MGCNSSSSLSALCRLECRWLTTPALERCSTRPRPTFLSGRAAGTVYSDCPFCPAILVWVACPVSQVSPAVDVLAAAFVPAFVAVVRVFVRAVAVGVVASAPFALAFVRAGVVVFHQLAVAVFGRPAVVFDRPAAAFEHWHYFVPASGVLALAAVQFSGVPGLVSDADPAAPVGASVRAAG